MQKATTRMKDHLRHQLWIGLTAAVLMLSGLSSAAFWDDDEGFFAGAAAEMYSQGEWIVPQFNGEMFGHKPPWMYWMMMCGFTLFGENEFAARFFSAVFGVATCLVTYHIGRRLIDARTGLWAGMIMASCLMFNVLSRAATPDTFLTFFAASSLLIFLVTGPFRSGQKQAQSADVSKLPSIDSLLPTRWHSFVAMYAVMGLAALVKGPIGFLFPMAVIGLFLLCRTPLRTLPADASWLLRLRERLRPFGPVNFLVTIWKMRIFTSIGVILLVAGPWFLAVHLRTDGAFLEEFFGVHHFQRFTSSMERHGGPFYYYVVSFLVGLFPWSIIALPATMLVAKHTREGKKQVGLLFLGCWAGVYLVIFSLAGTKLPNYVAPAYPALAILLAYAYQYWMVSPERVHRAWSRVALGILMFVGLTITAGLPLAGLWTINDLTLLDRVGLASEVQARLIWIGIVGVPAIVGGGLALLAAEKRQSQRAMVTLAVTAFTTFLLVWNFALPRVAQYQISRRIGTAIAQQEVSNETQVGSFGYFRPSLVYYVGQPLVKCQTQEDVQQFIQGDGQRILIATREQYEAMAPELATSFEVLRQLRRFPEKGELVLLQAKENPSRGISSMAEKESRPRR